MVRLRTTVQLSEKSSKNSLFHETSVLLPRTHGCLLCGQASQRNADRPICGLVERLDMPPVFARRRTARDEDTIPADLRSLIDTEAQGNGHINTIKTHVHRYRHRKTRSDNQITDSIRALIEPKTSITFAPLPSIAIKCRFDGEHPVLSTGQTPAWDVSGCW